MTNGYPKEKSVLEELIPGHSRDRTSTASFPRRFHLYIGERFPPAAYGAAILLFFLSASLLAQASAGASLAVGPDAVVGFLTLFLVFLRVRIADECKDVMEDLAHHPELPVARGLVSPFELKVVWGAASLAEIGLNLWLGLPVLLAYAFVLAFTVIMWRDFFLGAWLRTSRGLYILSQTLIVPILALYVLASQILLGKGGFHPMFGWYLLAVYSIGLLLDVASKKALSDKSHFDKDWYSTAYGTRYAAYMATGLLFVVSICATILSRAIGASSYYIFLTWVLFVVASFGILRSYMHAKPARNVGPMRLYAITYVAVIQGLIILELMSTARR